MTIDALDSQQVVVVQPASGDPEDGPGLVMLSADTRRAFGFNSAMIYSNILKSIRYGGARLIVTRAVDDAVFSRNEAWAKGCDDFDPLESSPGQGLSQSGYEMAGGHARYRLPFASRPEAPSRLHQRDTLQCAATRSSVDGARTLTQVNSAMHSIWEATIGEQRWPTVIARRPLAAEEREPARIDP